MASIALNKIYIPDMKVLSSQNVHEDELMRLVAHEMGAEVVARKRVTKLTGRAIRRAFRVDLSDGRRIKVRQFWNEKQAAEVAVHLRSLDRCHFPQLLSRVGPVLMLEWVEGQLLDGHHEDYSLYKRCGRLLAWIQCQPVNVESIDVVKRLPYLAPRSRTDVSVLRQWNLLTPPEAARLTDLLRREEPAPDGICLTHGDFCGENLILGRNQEIYSIDNEALTLGYPEGDLARALLRWNLSSKAQTAFLTGYSELRPLDGFHQAERYWKCWSLLRSIRCRYKAKEGGYQAPLSNLKQIISEPR